MSDIWGLTGTSVVVVGAGGGGIGTAIACHLGRAGAGVVAVDVDADKLRIATDRLAELGVAHVAVVADGKDPDAVVAAVARADELGPLHGGVQAAGGMWPDQWSPFASADPAFDDVMALNFGVTVNATRAIGTRLIEQGRQGAIVNIATVSALNAMPYGAAYAAAKAAVLSLTRTLAVEWGRNGIRVNAVAPGSIATPKSASARAPATPTATTCWSSPCGAGAPPTTSPRPRCSSCHPWPAT